MLFTIQAFVEDYISRRNLIDVDGYAVRVANTYFHKREQQDHVAFLRTLHRIRTVFFANNDTAKRDEFERALLERLDKKFKKSLAAGPNSFPGGVELERQALRRMPRRSVPGLLDKFKKATEARAIEQFWVSRKNGRLVSRPEKMAQSLFSMFLAGVLDNKGYFLRELPSGVGYVDIVIVLSHVRHLVELKVRRKAFDGPTQLAAYMKNEGRPKGYLLVIDASPPSAQSKIPARIETPHGVIYVVRVEINPIPPSRLN